MDYKELTDSELLQRVTLLHDVNVNEEWHRRQGMNLPYRLDMYGRIINCMSGMVMDDSQCDRLIVEQANSVRAARK